MPREPPKRDAYDIDDGKNGKVLLEVAVSAEEHEKTEAGTRERRGHESPRAHRALAVELRACDRNGAVWYEAKKPRREFAENRGVQAERLEAVLAEIVHGKFDRSRDDDDEGEYLSRVYQRGDKDSLVFAAAAETVLAKLVDVDTAAHVPRKGEDGVERKPDGDRGDDLELRSALVDRRDAAVAEIALARIVLHEARAAENGDLGAIVSHKGDRRAFELKKAGAYFYITFKTYLQEMGIDYKNRRIVYDIIATDEKIDGQVLYRFSRRVLPKESKELPITEGETPEAPVGDNTAEVAPVDADDSKEPVESEGE